MSYQFTGFLYWLKKKDDIQIYLDKLWSSILVFLVKAAINLGGQNTQLDFAP